MIMQSGIRDYVDAALGRRRLTLLIKNARLLNVHTGEIYPASIGIYDDRIVFVGKADGSSDAETAIDARGACAIPGLIDTHLHVESSMVTPSRFAEAILVHGTTTAIADPHEIANVLGREGVRMMVENAQGLPMRLYFWAPSCVPESQAVTSGAEITPEDVREMLGWPGIVGLGEVMDFASVLKMTPKMHEILEVARQRGCVVDGHSPLLTGRRLGAYITSGPGSDHENFTVESMVEKLRAGMHAKLRGPYILDTKAFLSALKRLPRPWNVIFVTDDVMPDNLDRLGHLDYVCRSFIEAGMDPVEAVRSCTLRPAQHMKMTDLGAISPGKAADLLLLRSLKRFEVWTVVSKGRVVARGGRLLEPIPQRPFAREALNSVKTGPLEVSDFEVRPPVEEGKVSVNAIDFTPYRGNPKNLARAFLEMVLTRLVKAEVEVERGRFVLGEVALVMVFDRHRGGGRRSFGFTRNLLRRGAVASTIAHDSHNLIVMGTKPRDMYSAAKLVVDSGGGIAAFDSRPLAHVELPVAGLMSEEEVGTVAKKMRALRRAFRKMGVLDHPYMPIVALLTLSVIPHVRITDKGIFDVDTQTFVPPYADK
jgi:adenine deaminase